jgi:hypothetical protein
MPNAIKYNVSTETLALKKGNFWIGTGDVGKGPTSSTGFYNGITPPTGGFTIYLNKSSGGPSIYTVTTEAQMVSLTNSIGSQNFTTSGQCLNWFATQTDKMIFNIDYPAIVTSGLTLNLDAGFTPSYSRSGTTWTDLSLSGNNGTLINGPTFNSDNGGSIVFDGVDDYGRVTNCVNALPQDITIEVWLKGTVDAYNNALEIGGGGSSIANELVARGSNSALNHLQYVSWYEKTDLTTNNLIALSQNDGMPISPTQFSQHVVWLKGDGTSGTYLNGSLFASNATPTSFTRWYIASRDLYFGFGIENIAVIRIYNRALPAQEVLQNYNATKSRFGL